MAEVNVNAIAVHNRRGTGLSVFAMRARWFGHVDEWAIPNNLTGCRIEATRPPDIPLALVHDIEE
jgi:hypothetical protein